MTLAEQQAECWLSEAVRETSPKGESQKPTLVPFGFAQGTHSLTQGTITLEAMLAERSRSQNPTLVPFGFAQGTHSLTQGTITLEAMLAERSRSHNQPSFPSTSLKELVSAMRRILA